MQMKENFFRLIPDVDGLNWSYIERLQPKRGWFTENFYRCLPLTIANQLGYVIFAPYNFSVEWTGGDSQDDLIIHVDESSVDDNDYSKALVSVNSSFGSGILTFYPRFMIKTPENISTLVKQPPNLRKQGVTWMEGAVETDNLLSTFSFNLKITDARRKIYFSKGEPIACLMPYERFFMDSFKLEISEDEEEIALYRSKQKAFNTSRTALNSGESKVKGHYRRGIDFEGCPFHNKHQVTVKNLDKQSK